MSSNPSTEKNKNKKIQKSKIVWLQNLSLDVMRLFVIFLSVYLCVSLLYVFGKEMLLNVVYRH
jgi:hypothetical protein